MHEVWQSCLQISTSTNYELDSNPPSLCDKHERSSKRQIIPPLMYPSEQQRPSSAHAPPICMASPRGERERERHRCWDAGPHFSSGQRWKSDEVKIIGVLHAGCCPASRQRQIWIGTRQAAHPFGWLTNAQSTFESSTYSLGTARSSLQNKKIQSSGIS